MLTKTAVLAVLAATAAAHSGVPLVKGDVGGAMSGLGYDPSVPVQNKNKNVIEVDANTMPSNKNAQANGFGTLNGKTKVTTDMADKAIQVGGAGQMPQVNKVLDITYRQMVVDGRFDEAAGAAVLIDPTGSGNFANAVKAKIISAPPVVKQANIKGTTVVGQDMNIKAEIPDGITCTGPNGTCAARIVNGKNEGNQLWGGHVLFQKVSSGSTTGATTGGATGGTTGATTGATTGGSTTGATAAVNGPRTKRHARDFTA